MEGQQARPSSYTLRQASTKDIPQLCAIERDATAKFASIPALSDLVESDMMKPAQVQEWLDIGRVYVVLDVDDQAAGFVAAHTKDDVLYIAEISVLRSHQGKGVGSLLMDTVLEWARERKRSGEDNAARVSLTTYADISWNGPWYRKRGFQEVDAASIGPKHVDKMTKDQSERNLVRPGYRRCCMLWQDR